MSQIVQGVIAMVGLASVPVAFLGLMLGVGGLVTAWAMIGNR